MTAHERLAELLGYKLPPDVVELTMKVIGHAGIDVIDHAELERLRAADAALGLFVSVIKSGEPWTSECEDAYRAARKP